MARTSTTKGDMQVRSIDAKLYVDPIPPGTLSQFPKRICCVGVGGNELVLRFWEDRYSQVLNLLVTKSSAQGKGEGEVTISYGADA